MKEKNLNFWLLSALIFSSILPLIVLSFYTLPNLEDYAESIIPNIWWHVKFLYLTYDGRFFTSYLFAAFNPLKYHSYLGYQFIPIVLLTSLFGSLFLLAKTFLFKDNLYAFLLSGLVFALYLHRIPHLAFSFYYMVSAYVYMVPSILFILYVSISYKLIHQAYSSLALLMLSTLLIFCVAGGNEFYLMPLLFWHILLFVIEKNALRSKKTELFTLNVALLCAYFIVFTSPGIDTFVEKNNTPLDIHHLLVALQTSASYTLNYLLKWLKHNYTLLAFSLFLVSFFNNKLAKDWINWSFKKSTILFAAGMVLGLFLILPYTIFGDEKLNPAYIQIYLIPVLYYVLLWTFYLALVSKQLPKIKLPNYTSTAIILLGTTLMYLDNQSQLRAAYTEWLDGTAQNYHAEMLQQISAAKNTTGILEICILQNQPKTIYSGVHFQLENRNFHLAFRKYYDLQDIKVKKCY